MGLSSPHRTGNWTHEISLRVNQSCASRLRARSCDRGFSLILIIVDDDCRVDIVCSPDEYGERFKVTGSIVKDDRILGGGVAVAEELGHLFKPCEKDSFPLFR